MRGHIKLSTLKAFGSQPWLFVVIVLAVIIINYLGKIKSPWYYPIITSLFFIISSVLVQSILSDFFEQSIARFYTDIFYFLLALGFIIGLFIKNYKTKK